MRIPSSAFASNMMSQLNSLNARQISLQQQLATGQKFVKASENPLSAQRVSEAQSEKAELVQFRDNADLASTLLEISSESLEYLRNIASTVSETGDLQGKLDTASEIDEFARSMNNWLEDAFDMANSDHDGDYLHGGAMSIDAANEPFVAVRDANGEITSISYNGSTNPANPAEFTNGREYYVADGAKVSPFTDAGTNQAIADMMNGVIALRDAQRTGTIDDIRTAVAAIDTAEDAIMVGVSDTGGKLARIDALQQRDASRFNALQDVIAAEITADPNEIAVELVQAQTVYQGALQSAGRILNTSILNYV